MMSVLRGRKTSTYVKKMYSKFSPESMKQKKRWLEDEVKMNCKDLRDEAVNSVPQFQARGWWLLNEHCN